MGEAHRGYRMGESFLYKKVRGLNDLDHHIGRSSRSCGWSYFSGTCSYYCWKHDGVAERKFRLAQKAKAW